MSSMQIAKVIPTNKVVDAIYEKHVRNPLDEWVSGKIMKTASLTTEDVSTIICLHIFGAGSKTICEVLGVNQQTVINVKGRQAYRNAKIPFVKCIRRVRGKLVTYYDEEKVIEYFNMLTPELKNVTTYNVIQDRLEQAGKIR